MSLGAQLRWVDIFLPVDGGEGDQGWLALFGFFEYAALFFFSPPLLETNSPKITRTGTAVVSIKSE